MSSERFRPPVGSTLIAAALAVLVSAWLAWHLVPAAVQTLGWPDWVSGLLIGLALIGVPLIVAARRVPGSARGDRAMDDSTPPDQAASIPSVAVLPLQDQSTEQDLAYLGDGLAEELQIVLSRTPGVRVASREACFVYRNRKINPEAVAQRLGVGNVVLGRLKRKGDKLRVSARLVAAGSGRRVLAREYLEATEDIFSVLVDIATELASALDLVIDPVELRRLSSLDPGAYDLYLAGRRYFLRGGLDNTAHAVALFARATESDPDFVRAWIALARAYALQTIYFEGSEAERVLAHKASERAVELAPERGECHSVRGLAHLASEEYEAAAAEFERAIDLDATLWEAYYNYARAAYHQGQMERALELFQTAIRVNPDDYQSPTLAAPVHKHLGDEAGFEASAAEGVRRAERHLEDYPDNQRAWYLGAVALLYLGQRDRALEWAEKSLAIDPSDPAIRYNMGCFYALAGDSDRAFECLQGSITSRSWVEHDPDLEPIRHDPRYQQLLESLE